MRPGVRDSALPSLRVKAVEEVGVFDMQTGRLIRT